MERVWQWLWDRYGTRYSWAVFGASLAIVLPIVLLCSGLIVAFEDSDRWLLALAVTALTPLPALIPPALPGAALWRPIERWAAGDPVDRIEALEATYVIARRAVALGVASYALTGAALGVVVAAIAGADGGRLVEWGLLGTMTLGAVYLIAGHSFVEAFLRPARLAIIGDTRIGDELPRSRPSFATWSNISILGAAWTFTLAGAIFGSVIDSASEHPAIAVLVASGMMLAFGVPITVGAAFAPSVRPLRDLAEGTARVAAGDYGQPLPVVQDDDLGVLVASFNRMQAGLAERERLHAAFGSYVDPALAGRLLEQGDDVFTGERRTVTVMFVDVRDFTPFAEAHAAEETVAHLNALFEIIVPTVLDAGGHVNKYLGDGALAVFGAPNELDPHAEAAVAAAVQIQQLVAERFAGATRIGIGINTGQVIAGTIGGGGKLEFTLIGDTVDALDRHPSGLVDRGAHALKGKAAPTRVFALGLHT
jgi:adenylate cyclase